MLYHRAAAPPPARRRRGQPGARRAGVGVSRAASWRPAASASRRPIGVRCSTSSRAFTTTRISSMRDGGWRRTPNAYLKAPARHGGARSPIVPGAVERDAPSSPTRAAVHDGGSRLPVSRLPGAARRNAGVVSRGRSPTSARASAYRPYHDRARAQIARELDLIEKLELAGYFLIVWDIVNFCRQHDILVQGRGSRGQQRRVLQPRHHGGRSGRHGSAVRAVPVGGARRVARHRSRSAERRSARARDPARLREATAGSARR